MQPVVEKEQLPCTEITNTLPPISDVPSPPVAEKENSSCTTNRFFPDTPSRTPPNADISNQPAVQMSDPPNDLMKKNDLSPLNDVESMANSNEHVKSTEDIEKSDFNPMDWIR